jgi:hypothetical protein
MANTWTIRYAVGGLLWQNMCYHCSTFCLRNEVFSKGGYLATVLGHGLSTKHVHYGDCQLSYMASCLSQSPPRHFCPNPLAHLYVASGLAVYWASTCRKANAAAACHLLSCWFLAQLIFSTLNMEASVDTQWTMHLYIPEDGTHHNHCCENLKSYTHSLIIRTLKCINWISLPLQITVQRWYFLVICTWIKCGVFLFHSCMPWRWKFKQDLHNWQETPL